MNHASRTPSNEGRFNRGFVGALFGAAMTVITLAGAVAVTEGPRQLSSITESLISTEVFEIMPPSWIEAPQPQEQALAPATGVYEDPALQVTYDVFA
jgi:hypothetical protein